MPRLSIAPNFGIVPSSTIYDGFTPSGYFEDTDAVWHHLLSIPQLGPKEGTCVRGAIFCSTARTATQLNVDQVEALVLDVDEWAGGMIPTPAAIHKRLFHHRAIYWTTYNHVPTAPRYRVVLPLAHPIARTQFRELWNLVNTDLGNIIGAKQFNADRLGYLPRLPRDESRMFYTWGILPGELFDPFKRYGEIRHTPDKVTYSALSPSNSVIDRSNWLPDSEAINKARHYMRDAHVGVEPGARHHKLFEKACQLWWDFYLDEQGVFAVLSEINQRLSVPKSQIEVLKEVEAGYEWTRGRNARPQSVPAGDKRQRPPRIVHQQIQDFAKKLKRRKHQLAFFFEALADNNLAIPPSVDDAVETAGRDLVDIMRSAARLLAEEFRNTDPQHIGELFSSQIAMAKAAFASFPLTLTVKTLEQVAAARQEEFRAAIKQKEDERASAMADLIEKAMPGRRVPYTADEFAEYAMKQNCTVAELKRRLIVAYGGSYHFFDRGRYSDGYENNIDVLAMSYLAAAEPLGIRLFEDEPKPDGTPKLRPFNDIFADYGVIADRAQTDLTSRESYYRHKNDEKTLVLASLTKTLEPKFDNDVNEYLKTINNEDMLDWLAACPDLSQPLRMLYLWGPPSTGKTLFASALSRLYTDNTPTSGRELFSKFNASIQYSPLVFMDEDLPEEMRGVKGTHTLREEIQKRSRTVEAKFKKSHDLIGCLRFVLSANRPDAIFSPRTNTTDDVKAISERLLLVHVPKKAGEFLERLGHQKIKRWVDNDVFAKHVLWMRDTRQTAPYGRFGPVPQAITEVSQHTSLLMRFSGAADPLLRFMYIAVTKDATTAKSAGIRVVRDAMRQRKVVFVDDTVRDTWEAVHPTERLPRELDRGFEAISARQGIVYNTKTDREQSVRVLDMELFETWLRYAKRHIPEVRRRIEALPLSADEILLPQALEARHD